MQNSTKILELPRQLTQPWKAASGHEDDITDQEKNLFVHISTIAG